MSPCGKIPKSVAQSQLKMCLYESFENHWHTMVWLNRGSKVKADIWWDDTIEWLEHVSLEHVSIEKINPVVVVPVPEHERRTSTVAWPKPSDRYWQSDSIGWKQRIKKHPYHALLACLFPDSCLPCLILFVFFVSLFANPNLTTHIPFFYGNLAEWLTRCPAKAFSHWGVGSSPTVVALLWSNGYYSRLWIWRSGFNSLQELPPSHPN